MSFSHPHAWNCILHEMAWMQRHAFPETFLIIFYKMSLCHMCTTAQWSHVYMDPCKSSSLCSLCFLLSYRTENNIQPRTDAILKAQLEDEAHLYRPKHIYILTLSFLNSSYSGLSVGNSSRHSGQELVYEWKHSAKDSKGILSSHSNFSRTCPMGNLILNDTLVSFCLPCPTRAVYIPSGKDVCKAFLELSLDPRTPANTQDTWDLYL